MDYLLSAVNGVLSEPQTIWNALIISLALFTRKAIGFGDAIIAVPFLSLMLDLNEVVPFVLFLSTVMSFVSVWKNRNQILFSSLKRTGVMALTGFPLGILLSGISDEQLIRTGLGLTLILLALWYFLPTMKIHLKTNA